MAMDKYGVEDRGELQRAELARIRSRLAELRGFEKTAAAGELEQLQRRESELLKSLADQ